MTTPQHKKDRGGWRRLIRAAGHSWAGLCAAWAHEAAFRQEVVVAAVLIPVAAWLHLSVIEKILLIGTVVLVLIVEVLNSALEAAIDRDSLEINPLGKRAKDLGSAAVMLALLLCAGTWVAVLLEKFG